MREITPEATSWGGGLRSYRRGDDAWPVVSLQLNLNHFGNRLELDGVIGPATEKVMRSFQAHRRMATDGVFGPASQQRLCIELATPPARRYSLPTGLMRGALENESGYMIACWTEHPSDAGFDLGALQDSFTAPASQQRYRDALDVAAISERTAATYRRSYDRYRSLGAAQRLGWECAALYHNWPAAADRMARGLGPTSKPDEPVEWVQAASGGRLSTPREWADAYIAAVCKFIDWSAV